MRFLLALAPLALAACGAPTSEEGAANTAEPATGNAAAGAPAARPSAPEPAENPQVAHAWIRLPAVPGRPAAAYFTLVGGAADDAVVAVTSPAAARAELHQSLENDEGVVRMEPIDTAPLPAGAQMDFAPGGKHVMLYDLDEAVAAGGTAPLTVDFETAPDVTVEAKLVAPGAQPMR